MKTTLFIIAFLLLSISIIYGMHQDRIQSYENPESWCIRNYSNESQRFIP